MALSKKSVGEMTSYEPGATCDERTHPLYLRRGALRCATEFIHGDPIRHLKPNVVRKLITAPREEAWRPPILANLLRSLPMLGSLDLFIGLTVVRAAG
jgi:hypothetical protein